MLYIMLLLAIVARSCPPRSRRIKKGRWKNDLPGCKGLRVRVESLEREGLKQLQVEEERGAERKGTLEE